MLKWHPSSIAVTRTSVKTASGVTHTIWETTCGLKRIRALTVRRQENLLLPVPA